MDTLDCPQCGKPRLNLHRSDFAMVCSGCGYAVSLSYIIEQYVQMKNKERADSNPEQPSRDFTFEGVKDKVIEQIEVVRNSAEQIIFDLRPGARLNQKALFNITRSSTDAAQCLGYASSLLLEMARMLMEEHYYTSKKDVLTKIVEVVSGDF